jgi:cell division septal protein FtsQ
MKRRSRLLGRGVLVLFGSALSLSIRTAAAADLPNSSKNSAAGAAEQHEEDIVRAVPIAFADNAFAKEVDGQPASAKNIISSLQAAFSRFAVTTSATAARLEDHLLRIKDVQVQGNSRLQTSEILRAAGLDTESWIWNTSADSVRSHLLDLPWIESAEVILQPFPARMKISLRESQPWLIAEYERRSWLVGKNGAMLQTLDTITNPDVILETTDLPRLDGLDSQVLPESYLASANARFLYAAKLIRLLQSAGTLPFSVERYTLLPNGSMKLTPARREPPAPEVLIAAENLDDAQLALQRLDSVQADLLKRGEHARRIDLRFKNQVIVE